MTSHRAAPRETTFCSRQSGLISVRLSFGGEPGGPVRITAGFLFDRTMRILVIVAEEFGRIKGLSSHNAGTTQQYGAFPELCIYYKNNN